MFENATTAMSDVVLPLESHAEKDGTVTHPDGRLQRVRPSASRPDEVLSNLVVLAELSSALGHDTNIASQPSALAALTDEVPFYAGIDDAEIAGRGVRWQEREAAAAIPGAGWAVGVASAKAQSSGESTPTAFPSANASTPGAGELALGSYRDLWAGPITELNPPLRFLAPTQQVELSPADAERMGLKTGDAVDVAQNGVSIRAQVRIKERVSEGVCFLIEGTAEDNANGLLNGGPVAVRISKELA
jgi:NADH-quinone oxidoreductase subunit G